MVNLIDGVSAQWVWLTAFAFSLVCLLAAGFEILFAKEPRSRWVRCLVWSCLLLVALVAVGEFVWYLGALPGGWELLGRGLLLGLAILGGIFLVAPRRSVSREQRAKRVSWGLVAITLFATVWCSGRFYSAASPAVDERMSLAASGDFSSCILSNVQAKTDQGSDVSLFENGARSELDDAAPLERLPERYSNRLIVCGPADRTTNCHGWVFTGGRFVVRSEAVDRILQENKYQQVSSPQVGDLFVCRDRQGEPNHTGVVKAIGEQGFVLIESKWGFTERYLHEPQDQCYSENFAYYRSSRVGHLVRIDEPAIEQAEGTSRTARVVTGRAVPDVTRALSVPPVQSGAGG